MKTNTVVGFLLEELHKRGVRHIFGVPGDYILPFANALEAFDGIEHITMADERDAAWAANLVGRKQLSVCYATSMVGCLNILNPVNDATQKLSASSLVIIGGEVALSDRKAKYILHHELDAPPAPLQGEIFKMLLGGGEYVRSITDALSAERDISQLLDRACDEHRPVYIGIPKDVFEMPRGHFLCKEKMRFYEDEADKHALLLAQRAGEVIMEAKNPVLFVGQFAERFGLIPLVQRFARMYGIPIVATHKGFGAYPLDDDYFMGTYSAQASYPPDIQKIVEQSDRLIRIGAMDCDMTHGLRVPNLPQTAVNIDPALLRLSPRVCIGFLEHVVSGGEARKRKTPVRSFLSWMNNETSHYFHTTFRKEHWIRFADIAPLLHDALQFHPGTPVVVDIGNAMTIPVVTSGGYYTSPYGAMGVTVGALGVEMVAGKRPLVIVGDGAFDMWSLGAFLALRKYHSKMVVVVLNNAGWGMLRPIAGNAPYLDLPSGHFEKLAPVVGAGHGFRAQTPMELAAALKESFSSDTFSVINVILRKDDMTDTIRQFMASS